MLHLRAADGATAAVSLFGAHVTSWRPIPGGDERLFLSERSALDGTRPIRGGVPVIFPQFNVRGPLPKHGFARTSMWTREATECHPYGDVSASLLLLSDAATLALWPHAFIARLTVRVGGPRLVISLAVENVGSTPLEFTAALHSYFRVHDTATTELVGLHGARFEESGDRASLLFDEHEVVRLDRAIDRVYLQAPDRVTLREPDRQLDIDGEGFPDIVVWNPGVEGTASLPDMAADEEREMVCVEAAAVAEPIVLNPGRRWEGSQTCTVMVR